MNKPLESWDRVDKYIERSLLGEGDQFDWALRASHNAGLPNIAVTPAQGKALMLLARACGAKRVLEVGTLGGYSTLWLARGIGANGRVTTLEVDEKHAGVARENFARAGMSGQIDLRVGRAADTLPALGQDIAAGVTPAIDLTFIDADKPSTPEYLDWALRMSRPGAVIVIDNVVRNGEVANEQSADASVVGIRRTVEKIRREPRLEATAIQTVGAKGYDGFLVAVVSK